MRTYLFTDEKGRFIINDERSTIGYSYPRVFIEIGNKYANLDLTLGMVFNQKKSDFESWLDGTEIEGEDYENVCANLGINAEGLAKAIENIRKNLEVCNE